MVACLNAFTCCSRTVNVAAETNRSGNPLSRWLSWIISAATSVVPMVEELGVGVGVAVGVGVGDGLGLCLPRTLWAVAS